MTWEWVTGDEVGARIQKYVASDLWELRLQAAVQCILKSTLHTPEIN